MTDDLKTRTWMCYSLAEMDERPPACQPDKPSVRENSGYYFLPDTSWRDVIMEAKQFGFYRHRYEVVNLLELTICHIDLESIAWLPPLDSFLRFNWQFLYDRGYDGVLIHRNQLMSALDHPDPWFIFGSAREDDELIIWRNFKLAETPMDLPDAPEDEEAAEIESDETSRD